MSKLAQLTIPDNIYNWIRNFYQNRSHSTKYDGLVSTVAEVLASVIQGSALGPASCIVTAPDLHPVHAGNRIFKFADDTYLVVPAINSGTCTVEIEHMQTWAAIWRWTTQRLRRLFSWLAEHTHRRHRARMLCMWKVQKYSQNIVRKVTQ